MSKSDHDTYKQASHTIPATSIASVSVTVPRFVQIIRISSLARHLLSADFYLGHYSSQSLISDIIPLAPSIVPNAISARTPVEMSDADVEKVVSDFAAAGQRAKWAGFDGVHLHSGNGYLLSQFNSAVANRRDDRWGSDPQRRARFILEVYRAVRRATGADFPITARLGVADAVVGGLALTDGIAIARQLASEGLDSLEVPRMLQARQTPP